MAHGPTENLTNNPVSQTDDFLKDSRARLLIEGRALLIRAHFEPGYICASPFISGHTFRLQNLG
ncbi:protein of unknown function (plasmid) [Paraburkholderia dioscoreae]|uniref:Uncharacterized protein n=1 Tax=Paraburkholderia dioscoreae TaxID=2604047 RepID=A0A5Q4ZR35_9BURK|nr:protein of unknown function [Paraburkholderia dioscoreae]